ncbi:MAG: radical SAM protein, partial [Acidobacteriota bacterium]
MESTVPLYCRIPTDENQYLYDAATNRLFRVSKYVYDHVEDLSRMSKDEVACEASKRSIQDAEHLRSSHTALQEQRARYNLLPTVHPRIGLQLSASQIETSIMGRCHNFILEVTEKCNLRCRYCIYSGFYPNNRSHGSASMDSRTAGQAVDLAHRHVNALPAETPVGIGFTGGEPLLNWPLITDAADYARRKSWGGRTVMLNLTSNATLLKKEHLDFFIDHAFNLTVSLDGPRGVHDRGRVFADGNRGTYRKVRRAVDMIRERDPGYFDQRVMFSAVLSYPIDWTVLDEFFRVELDLPPGKVLFSNIRRGSKAGFDLPSGTEIEIGHEEIEKRFMEAAQQGVLFGDFEPGSRQAKLQSEGKSCLTFPIQIGPMIRFHERPLFSGWP